jgi:hypothetical protein
MTNIEKPIEIGLQRVGNRYETKFYCSRFSNAFFGLKLYPSNADEQNTFHFYIFHKLRGK